MQNRTVQKAYVVGVDKFNAQLSRDTNGLMTLTVLAETGPRQAKKLELSEVFPWMNIFGVPKGIAEMLICSSSLYLETKDLEIVICPECGMPEYRDQMEYLRGERFCRACDYTRREKASRWKRCKNLDHEFPKRLRALEY